MALETKHYINGVQVRPKNADDIGFKVDWTGDISEAELTTDSIVLVTEARELVLNHINTLGPFEGIPYTIEIGTTSIEYYIDLTDGAVISGEGDSEIEVTIKRRQSIAKFKEDADALIWELVNKRVGINVFDIDYVIVKDNQIELFIMLGITTYQLTKALIEGVKEISEAAADIAETLPPLPANIGALIAASIKLIARIIYTAALLVALIRVAKDIIELVFPPVKKFKAVKVKELLEKGCLSLGYNFSSSITDWDNMTILPKPTLCVKDGIFKTLFTFDNGLRTTGYPTGIAGDSVTTFGQLIDFCLDYANAESRVIGNTFYIEENNYWNNTAGVQIHRTLTLQDVRENRWQYNTGEAWKRYYLRFQQDTLDLNTYDDSRGIYSEHQTDPITVVNDDLVLIKGLVTKDFPFALGQRKEGLNFIEKAFLPFAALADGVTGFFGGSQNFVSKINGRVGVLVISQQYFGVTKLLWTVNGKQPANFRDLLGAEHAYQTYHTSNQVKENFKRIYSATIPFSTENFNALLGNNYVNDQDGNSLEVLNLEWTNQSKTAQIEFAISSDEGDNTKTIIIDGGGTSGTTETELIC